MKPSPCVVILAHPNTDRKLQIMMDSIQSVKNLNIPIYVFSNMDIPEQYLKGCNGFVYTGDNTMWSASDILSEERIVNSRNITKYREHLTDSNHIITYVPIYYGTEKSYYWALTNLYKISLEKIAEYNHTHFMLLQYDTILDSKNLVLANNYINELYSSNLDGIITVDPGMGDNHMNDYSFFGKVSYWNEMFSTTSIEEFYNLIYPNWTIEEYYYTKCKIKGGNIKIKIRTDLAEWQKNYYKDLPSTWEREDIDCHSHESIHLLFPNLEGRGLGDFRETPTFDVERSLVVSIGTIYGDKQLFVLNKPLSNLDRTISVKIQLYSNDNTPLPSLDLTLNPGIWYLDKNFVYSDGQEVVITYYYSEGDQELHISKKYIL